MSAAERPERWRLWHTTLAASSVGGISLSAPPNFPMGVRTALSTTTSRLVIKANPFDSESEWSGLLIWGRKLFLGGNRVFGLQGKNVACLGKSNDLAPAIICTVVQCSIYYAAVQR